MTISYELAKQLKDAGFPQPGVASDYPGYFSCGCDDLWAKKDKLPDAKEVLECGRERAYKPTLSELIEACGERFFGIFKCDAHAGGGHCWRAEETNYTSDKPVMIHSCSTPEEAVANLWLALNTNSHVQ